MGDKLNTATPESGAPFNPVEDIIYQRRSVRIYKKNQVPEYLVRRILEAGRYAPSAGNAQPWKFIVIQDRTMISDMTNDMVNFCKKTEKLDYTRNGSKIRELFVSILRRFMINDFHPVSLAAMWQIARGNLDIWHGAPTVIIILVDNRAPGKPMLDVGIAGQNMVLTAHSLGLGTCWVGFAEIINRLPKWKKKLGIKYPYRLGSSIALGFPVGQPDGYVERETQIIDWFDENGNQSKKY